MVARLANCLAGSLGWAPTQSLSIWRCIVFPLLVFVTLIAIRCSCWLAALGGKLIAFAAQLFLFLFFVFRFSVFGFYYLKFMSVFSEELSQRERARGRASESHHAVFMLVDPFALPTFRAQSGNGNCRATAQFIVFSAAVVAAFLFSSLFCNSFTIAFLFSNPCPGKLRSLTSVSPLVAYITFN